MKAIVTEGRSVNWKGRIYLPGEEVKDLPKDEGKRLRRKGAVVRESHKKTAKKAEHKYGQEKTENVPVQKPAEKVEGDNA